MYRLGYFRCDVTPPAGHPLLGGMGAPARSIADRQLAHGLVLCGEHMPPVLLLTLDWCLLCNSGYALWREALASALSTQAQRIFIHTVHQHDAVLADPGIEEELAKYHLVGSSLDGGFFQECLERVVAAARTAMEELQPVTHVGRGLARVHEVAANRRVLRPGTSEMVLRRSWCRDESLRAEPEGLIDPFVRTVSFHNGGRLLAAMHYYATHPMSYYGEGDVSRDFCAMARDDLATETGAPQLYFTGAAGNISAGKYNDGSPSLAAALRERMQAAMRRSLLDCQREPLNQVVWKVVEMRLSPREEYGPDYFHARLANPELPLAERCQGAFGLSAVKYLSAHGYVQQASCLRLNDIRILHLPGEPFIEYQLFAAQTAPHHFVAFAGYGDGGPCYLPTEKAYPEGGYECSSVAFTGPASDQTIRQTIRALLR